MPWKNKIQLENDRLAKDTGFKVDYNSTFKIVPEIGELVDAVLKLEGLKKIKSTDCVDDLYDELRGEIADVLVLLGQVATNYNIDMEEAFIEKIEKIRKRSFIN